MSFTQILHLIFNAVELAVSGLLPAGLMLLSKAPLELIALAGFAGLGWLLLIVNVIWRDFPNMLMDKDNRIFYQIGRVRRRHTVPTNVKVREVVVLHYIAPEHQVQLRAYKDLALINDKQIGTLPLYVRTSFSGAEKTVEYFTWLNSSVIPEAGMPKLYIVESPFPPPTIQIRNDYPENLVIFKHYGDKDQPDFFLINPVAIKSSGHLEHYVIVRNEDLSNWNPNKFIFETKPSKFRIRKTVVFSDAVYITLDDADERFVKVKQLLVQFDQLQRQALDEQRSDNFKDTNTYLGTILNDAKVTVFFCRMNTEETNLFLAYFFPNVQQPDGPRSINKFYRQVREVIKI